MFNVNPVPKLLFTPETARALGKKSAEVRARRKQLAVQAAASVAIAVAASGQNDLQAHSRAARFQLSNELLVQLQILKATPPVKLSDLPNSPDGEGRASLVARITDTAAKVYGWDSEKGSSVVLIGLVSSMDPDASQQPAIDVESTPA
jgi:phenylpyruvate tautomerase PptA (4-oxalocrotonate tautomerase family)